MKKILPIAALLAAPSFCTYGQSVAFDSLTKMTNNGTTFNLSVVDGAASYQPNFDTGSDVVVVLGDGTLLDWKLLGGSNLNGQTVNNNNVGYANGPASFINDPTSTASDLTDGLIYTPQNWAKVWHTSDPGVDFLLNPADQTTFTVLNSGATSLPMGPITGTVDISTISSGEFFFFAGGYQANTDYTVTLTGPGQSDLTATYKDIINANNNRVNTVIFDFDNAGLLYNTLTWQYKHNAANLRGRFMGVAIDGIVTPAFDPADLDQDGDVDDADFGIAFAAFTGPGNGPTTSPADLDDDGDVDDADFGIAFAAFTGPGGGAASVPEPTSLALLGLGGLMVARRRRA